MCQDESSGWDRFTGIPEKSGVQGYVFWFLNLDGTSGTNEVHSFRQIRLVKYVHLHSYERVYRYFQVAPYTLVS